jgi:hypothetical protein
MQNLRAKPNLRLRVSGEVPFGAFGEEPLAPTLPPPRERGPAALRLHAGAESMLAFSRALRSL